MSSPSSVAPPGGDENRAGKLIAIYWTQQFVAVLVIALRMWSRKLTRAIGWDDWLMFVSLIMQLVLAGFVTHYALIGGTRHLYYLTPVEVEQVLKWSYIFQCWGISACTPSKVSVALLIRRITNPLRGWRFWTLVVSLAILILWNTLDSIFTYVQCDPAAALWDKSIKNAKCWPPSVQAKFSVAQGSYNVFVDALLAIIPATIVYKLRIEAKKKIGLSVLLGLGLFAAVAGSIKTSKLGRLGARSDLTWDMYNLIIWAGTENWVVLICGSVPAIKPLWDRAMSKDGLITSLHFSWRSRGASQSSVDQNGLHSDEPKSGTFSTINDVSSMETVDENSGV